MSRMSPDLFEVGLRVRVDLLLRQAGPGRRATGRIADLGGEVAEDEHRDMPEVLEQPQAPQHDREAEMDVGCGRVDPQLHPQRPARLELGAQLLLGDDVDRARGQELHLAIDVHGSFRSEPSGLRCIRTVSTTDDGTRRALRSAA